MRFDKPEQDFIKAVMFDKESVDTTKPVGTPGANQRTTLHNTLLEGQLASTKAR